MSCGGAAGKKPARFAFSTPPIKDLAGSPTGIIGSGALGSSAATMAQALGMKVLYAERKGQAEVARGYTPFDEGLRGSGVITLHCLLVPATRNLIGAEEFKQMTRKPLLINTARGGFVNEKALAAG